MGPLGRQRIKSVFSSSDFYMHPLALWDKFRGENEGFILERGRTIKINLSLLEAWRI